MSCTPTETTKPKRKSPSQKKIKVKASAPAFKPLIAKLYDGTADILIRIPHPPNKNKADGLSRDDRTEQNNSKEIIELTLPPFEKITNDNDRVAVFTSALISALLNDINSAKQANRKAIQAAGIARAQAEGKQFGKKCRELNEDLLEELYQAYWKNEISAREAGKRLGCSYKTFQRRYYLRNPGEKRDSKECPENQTRTAGTWIN